MKKTVLLLPFLFIAACGFLKDKAEDIFKDPPITEVRNTLKTTFPLSFAAATALDVMEGASIPGVTVVNGTPGSTSGTFLIYIAVSDSMPLPAGVTASGKITVGGLMTGTGSAMMTVLFSDMNVSSGTFTVQDVSTFPVVRRTDIISGKESVSIVYADIDVNAGSDTLLTVDMSSGQQDAELTRYETMKDFDSTVTVEEAAWIITVDNNNTPGLISDDTYTINGGGQYVEAGSGGAGLLQLTMIGAQLSPVCTKNPQAGWALYQNMEVDDGGTGPGVEAGHVFLTFHSGCDGTVDVTAATGVYTGAWGDKIALDLGE